MNAWQHIAKACLLVPILFLATGCGEGRQILTQEESLATIPVMQNAGPGFVTASAYDAGVIFADTCLVRGPNFEDYAYGLRVHNVTRNAETGTFYHNSYNLSVRVADGKCSMVFFSDAPVRNVLTGTGQGVQGIVTPMPKGIDVTSRPAPNGNGRYYRLLIEAPVVLDEGWTLNG